MHPVDTWCPKKPSNLLILGIFCNAMRRFGSFCYICCTKVICFITATPWHIHKRDKVWFGQTAKQQPAWMSLSVYVLWWHTTLQWPLSKDFHHLTTLNASQGMNPCMNHDPCQRQSPSVISWNLTYLSQVDSFSQANVPKVTRHVATLRFTMLVWNHHRQGRNNLKTFGSTSCCVLGQTFVSIQHANLLRILGCSGCSLIIVASNVGASSSSCFKHFPTIFIFNPIYIKKTRTSPPSTLKKPKSYIKYSFSPKSTVKGSVKILHPSPHMLMVPASISTMGTEFSDSALSGHCNLLPSSVTKRSLVLPATRDNMVSCKMLHKTWLKIYSKYTKKNISKMWQGRRIQIKNLKQKHVSAGSNWNRGFLDDFFLWDDFVEALELRIYLSKRNTKNWSKVKTRNLH